VATETCVHGKRDQRDLESDLLIHTCRPRRHFRPHDGVGQGDVEVGVPGNNQKGNDEKTYLVIITIINSSIIMHED